MTASSALRHRLDERRSVLVAHLAMLEEAAGRDGGLDPVQLDLIANEMQFLADLYRTMSVAVVRDGIPEGGHDEHD